MWNKNLDIESISQQFSQTGRVIIRDAFDQVTAESLLRSISEIDEQDYWYRSQLGNPSSIVIDDLTHPSHFSYCFDRYPVVNIPLETMNGTNNLDGPHAERDLSDNNPIRRFGAFINGQLCCNLISDVTQKLIVPDSANCFLSKYQAGHYLAAHHDDNVGVPPRSLAFVYGLTPKWLPHWGGHTLFIEGPDWYSSESLIPDFNALILFNIPTFHAVTTVSKECPLSRYSMTGWFHADRLE